MCMMALLFLPAAFAQKRGGKQKAATKKTVTNKQTWDFSTIDNLLPLYVTAKAENKDFNSSLTGILVFYGGLSDVGKRECRKHLVDKMDEYYDGQKPTEALAVADIYESIAPVNDFGRLRLYYYRGEQAATATGDTVMLKQYINDIISLPDSGNERKSECLVILNGYLEEIRNYIPVDKTIDGVWVSNINRISDGVPFFVLNIYTDESGKTTFILSNKSDYLPYAYSLYADNQTAQEEFVFKTDSIYALWSNEDLKKPSPELNSMFRQTAGTFASALGTKAAIEGNAALGNLTSSIVGLGVDAIADAIFTPSKRAYLLQMKMRKINDRQIEADIFSTKMKVKGDNKPKLTDDKWHTVFIRVEPEDSLYWYNGVGMPISPFDMPKEEAKAFRKKYKYPKALLNYGKMKTFNNMQFCKALLRNERRILEQGDTLSNLMRLHDQNIYPVAGIIFQDEKSNVVKEVYDGFPADWAGIKKKDIITHIDGYEVNTYEQFKSIITRKKPFDTITLTIKRKKETMEIPLELYFIKG